MNDNVKYVGTVIWFNPMRGFGFLEWEKDNLKQKDLFIHFSDIICEGFKTLNKGQKVSFSIGKNNRGDPKAIDVTIVKN